MQQYRTIQQKMLKIGLFEQVGKWTTSIVGIQEDVSGMFTN